MPPKKKFIKPTLKKPSKKDDQSEDGTVKESIDDIEEIDEDDIDEIGDMDKEVADVDGDDEKGEIVDSGEKVEQVPMHEQFSRKPNRDRDTYEKEMKKVLKQSTGKDRKDPKEAPILTRVPYDFCDPCVFYKFRTLVEKARGNKYPEKTVRVYRAMDVLRYQ